jgi:hypothetical protein
VHPRDRRERDLAPALVGLRRRGGQLVARIRAQVSLGGPCALGDRRGIEDRANRHDFDLLDRKGTTMTTETAQGWWALVGEIERLERDFARAVAGAEAAGQHPPPLPRNWR